MLIFFFFSSRRRHTRCSRDWSSDVCSSDLFLPCCLAVCRMLVSTAWARAPRGVRLPPQFLRAPIRARMARSLTLFVRSEEHTSELQSRLHLVCRLLLEKKKTRISIQLLSRS